MKRWSVETQVLVGFTLALVVLGVVGAQVYRAMNGFIETSAAAARSQQALTGLEGVVSWMNHAETRQRGYLIMGDKVDLPARRAAVDRIDALFTELESLLADEPDQYRRLRELERRATERLKLLDWVLDGRTEGLEAARGRLARSPGRDEMRKVRELAARMQEAETARLDRRRAAADQRAQQTLVALLALLGFSAVSLSLLYARIRREGHVRRRAEAARERLIGQLESANEELRNFAYVVSHDLKAPLRGIASLADWISTDHADRLDTEGREHLRLLNSRVRRMDALIDGILEYSRAGRTSEGGVEIDTDALVRETVELLAPPPHIQVHVEPGLPTIVAERTRLQQIFQNLFSNAIKYIDKAEGEVRIGAQRIDGDWQFHVSDNGPGLEERHRARVFQLFQTLAPADRVEGTGVGLALVKKIVEQWGGRVWVESTPGRGSTFFFTLPVSDARGAGAGEATG